MLRPRQLPKHKESCLRQTRLFVQSMRLGCERKIQTPLSIQLQTQPLRYGFRSRYERRRAAETKKVQTAGARLRIARTSGHSSRRNFTLNRRTSFNDCNKCGQPPISALRQIVGLFETHPTISNEKHFHPVRHRVTIWRFAPNRGGLCESVSPLCSDFCPCSHFPLSRLGCRPRAETWRFRIRFSHRF